MPSQWSPATFKGKKVWAEVGADGALAADGGRVPIRYSPKEGATIYRAGASGVKLDGGGAKALPDGVSADANKPAGKSKRGSGFGSAGSRTKAQAAMAADAAKALLAELPDTTVVAFTDGSCKGNPGPAGAGATVRFPDGRTYDRAEPLGKATNNVGELSAVGLVLDALDLAGSPADVEVALLTDSSYAHGVLVKGWKAKANRELILGLRERLEGRKNLTLYWVAGHVGIEGNERADALANLGVEGIRIAEWREPK